MNKKTFWSVLVIVAAVIVLIAGNYRLQHASNNNTIKIGAVLSLSGSAAPWGEYEKNGIDLAVKEINANNGINGRKVEVVIEDDHTDGKQAVSAFNKLISIDGVQGIIGGVFDFTAQPLIPLALSEKLAFISPSNFRIAGGFDLNDQSFVMMTDFSTVIRNLKDYVSQPSVKKMAVVHFKSTFGDEIAKTLNSVLQELGKGGLAVDEAYTKIGDNDFKTTILKLKQAGIDTVFIDMLGNDPVNFLKRSKELGFTPTVITYNGALDSFSNESDKNLLNGVVILNWEVTSPQFDKLYKEEYGIMPAKSADKSFDAVYVMANAIAKSNDLSQVASVIEKNSVATPNAKIEFTPNHTVGSTPVVIDIVKNGVLVPWQK